MLNIAAAARRIRDTLGLKQTELAELLGVTSIFISNIETGVRIPTWKTLERYRELTGVDPYVMAWCLGESDGEEPQSRNATRLLGDMDYELKMRWRQLRETLKGATP